MLYFKTTVSYNHGTNSYKTEDNHPLLKALLETTIDSYLENKNICNICTKTNEGRIIVISRVNPKDIMFTYNEDMLKKSILSLFSEAEIAEHDISIAKLEETTRGHFNNMASFFRDSHNIASGDAFNKLDIEFGMRMGNSVDVSYYTSKKEHITDINKLTFEPYYPDLSKELTRVSSNKVDKFTGHPVHYLLNTDDNSDILDTLVYTLKSNNRLLSSSIAMIELDEENVSKHTLESIYKLMIGGTVAFFLKETIDSGNSLSLNSGANYKSYQDIADLCSKYRHKVLTVLCFPMINSAGAKKTLKENMSDTLSFVEINVQNLSGKKARAYLNNLAERNNIAKCTMKLDNTKSFTCTELAENFNKWFDGYLKTNTFASYAKQGVVVKNTKVDIKGAANKKLNEMIGLSEVKKLLKQVLSYFKMQKIYKERGINVESPCRHMIFSGNPGTAKTTVARLFGDILKDNGILTNGRVIELGRSDLVEKYVGWTAKRVKEQIENAEGGILFIDEAYSLVDDRSGGFGDEAINTLVQEMDKVRETTIIILAGYPDKMEDFMDTNPGIRSRIAFNVNFPNYTSDELLDVMKLMADSKKLILEREALSSAREVINRNIGSKDFGNGRFIRGLLERASMNQSARIIETGDYTKMTNEELLTIKSDDVTYNDVSSKPRIGFGI